jgi:hypothetical protein
MRTYLDSLFRSGTGMVVRAGIIVVEVSCCVP